MPVKWLLGFKADAFIGQHLAYSVRSSSQTPLQEGLPRMKGEGGWLDCWRIPFRTACHSLWLKGLDSNGKAGLPVPGFRP